jgi:hypothetical protein
MCPAPPTASSVDDEHRALYRAGGISALLIGIGYLAIFPLYARVGAPPMGDGEVWLRYLAGKTTVWWAILWLSVLTDFLFVPVGLSLFVALQRISRTRMLVATALVLLFVVLDLTVTWSHYASLLTLSARYDAATTDGQRAMYVAAATYGSAIFASRLFVVYAILDLSSAILLIATVMLRGTFNRTAAWIGLATGVSGIASIAGWGMTIIANALLATVWLLLVGYRLCQLARVPETKPQSWTA